MCMARLLMAIPGMGSADLQKGVEREAGTPRLGEGEFPDAGRVKVRPFDLAGFVKRTQFLG